MPRGEPSRRRIIQGLAALGLTSLTDWRLQAAEPHLDFPQRAQDRLSVTSYPFRAYIDAPGNTERDRTKPGMDLKDFGATVAKKFNIRNINPLASHFGSSTPAYISEFRSSLEKAGSRVVDLGLGGKMFYHPDAAKREEAVEYGKKWIDIAVEIGAPSVRQHLHPVASYKADVSLAALSLGKLSEHGAKKNIVVNLENDDPLSEDPFFLVQVIEKVDNPYLRGLPDFGNSILPSGDAELNAKAVRGMFRHVWNMCHVKMEVADGHGKIYHVDLARMFAIAREIGYRGYYCMEAEMPSDPFTATSELIRETLKYIS
jgi:sugar phosphate isomerase/epimerase